MLRIFLLKIILTLPEKIRQPLVRHCRYRKYNGFKCRNFEVAPLLLCPKIAMHDLVSDCVICEAIALNGFFDWPHTLDFARRAAATDGLFVDVGANMGYFSLLWAGVCASGRVVAYEASPRNINIFQTNIVRNSLQDRITLVPKAAGDRTGSVTFDVGPSDQTGWGGISNTTSSTTVTVPMVRLDEDLHDRRIQLLKIDVEGADTWVLFGCEDLLKKRNIQTIYFEQNKERMECLGIAPGEAQKFLNSVGYECHPISKDDGEWIAYPKN